MTNKHRLCYFLFDNNKIIFYVIDEHDSGKKSGNIEFFVFSESDHIEIAKFFLRGANNMFISHGQYKLLIENKTLFKALNLFWVFNNFKDNK